MMGHFKTRQSPFQKEYFILKSLIYLLDEPAERGGAEDSAKPEES